MLNMIVDFKTGIDIYLTNQRFARSTLAPMIKRKFDGKLTITKSSLWKT